MKLSEILKGIPVKNEYTDREITNVTQDSSSNSLTHTKTC